MPLFTAQGERARWRVVYDVLTHTPTGEAVSYETLANALGLHPRAHRRAIYAAVRRAAKEHEEVDHRAIEAVANVGYRIVESVEHLKLARRHQSKATKALSRGQSKVVNVDMTGMDQATRRTFEVVARGFALQADFNRRFAVRQEELEKTINAIDSRSARSEEEINELRTRLERIEQLA